MVYILPHSDLPQFFIIASHTRPSDAVNEINALVTVFNSAAEHFNTVDGIIMGDLNADCSYVSKSVFKTLALFNNTNFTWWISSDNDTTTSPNTHCAYDRYTALLSYSRYCLQGLVLARTAKKINLQNLRHMLVYGCISRKKNFKCTVGNV